MKKRILITGKSGQLGSELGQEIKNFSQFEFTLTERKELDLSQPDSIRSFFRDKSFDFVINCAAYTEVDKAEDEEELAFRVNGEAPGILAEICKKNNSRLFHVSTDYVFNGRDFSPITEEEDPDPINAYGGSKLEGERNIMAATNDAYIIRSSWIYSSFGKNFLKTMLRLGKERGEVRVVSDQVGSPTYALELGRAILTMVDSVSGGTCDSPGFYHYSNGGVASWYDFAISIFNLTSVPCSVHPIPSTEFKTKAKRPFYSVLDKTKIIKNFNLEINHWQTGLSNCLASIPVNRLEE